VLLNPNKTRTMRPAWVPGESNLNIAPDSRTWRDHGFMSVKLNKQGVRNARAMIKAGKVVRDDRDAWSEHAKAAGDETDWVKKHGWGEFSEWHLGVDPKASAETKGRYSFPFGDYAKVHRCAVISLESRAAQYGHKDIAKSAKRLLTMIDKKGAKKR
jgi:hypothetical protein